MGVRKITSIAAPAGNTAYAQKVLDVMRTVTVEGLNDPDVRMLAKKLIGKTSAETLQNDFLYLKKKIIYVPDPIDSEDIKAAKYTAVGGEGGDCDDMSVAAATILILQGFSVCFRAIAWRTNDFTHVYVVANLKPPVNFDLTLENLNDVHPIKKSYDLQMPVINAIQDSRLLRMADNALDQIKADADKLYGKDANAAAQAFVKLYKLYPSQMRSWYTQHLMEGSLLGYHPAEKMLSTPFVPMNDGEDGTIGPEASEADVTFLGIDLTSIWNGIQSFVANNLPNILKSIDPFKAGGSSNSPADPAIPGRTVTDARTFAEQVLKVYPTAFSTIATNPSPAFNYSTVLILSSWPPTDQNLNGTFPGHIMLSLGGDSTPWYAQYLLVRGTPWALPNPLSKGQWYDQQLENQIPQLAVQDALAQGKAFWSLNYKNTPGNPDQTSPGFYTLTFFPDGTLRFDFRSMNQADMPVVSTAKGNPNYLAATIWRYEGGYKPGLRNSPGTGFVQNLNGYSAADISKIMGPPDATTPSSVVPQGSQGTPLNPGSALPVTTTPVTATPVTTTPVVQPPAPAPAVPPAQKNTISQLPKPGSILVPSASATQPAQTVVVGNSLLATTSNAGALQNLNTGNRILVTPNTAIPSVPTVPQQLPISTSPVPNVPGGNSLVPITTPPTSPVPNVPGGNSLVPSTSPSAPSAPSDDSSGNTGLIVAGVGAGLLLLAMVGRKKKFT